MMKLVIPPPPAKQRRRYSRRSRDPQDFSRASRGFTTTKGGRVNNFCAVCSEFHLHGPTFRQWARASGFLCGH